MPEMRLSAWNPTTPFLGQGGGEGAIVPGVPTAGRLWPGPRACLVHPAHPSPERLEGPCVASVTLTPLTCRGVWRCISPTLGLSDVPPEEIQVLRLWQEYHRRASIDL